MPVEPKNILIFVLLLGGVAHVMLFQNGYWNDFMWISAMLAIIIPCIGYRYWKRNSKRIRRKNIADI